MKRFSKKTLILFLVAILSAGSVVTLTSCGSMHSYWGVENDYYTDGYMRPHGKHKPPKPPKHHKHKKHKHHHHHDD